MSIVNSNFRNGSTNILCDVLNIRLLKPTILKFSLMFIKFRYNLSFRVDSRYILPINPRWSNFDRNLLHHVCSFCRQCVLRLHYWVYSRHCLLAVRLSQRFIVLKWWRRVKRCFAAVHIDNYNRRRSFLATEHDLTSAFIPPTTNACWFMRLAQWKQPIGLYRIWLLVTDYILR